MRRARCVIVDDEPLARLQLRARLAELPEAELVGEAGNVQQGADLVRRLRPDVLLLDIQLRGESGFDLLRQLPAPPAVIFVTAFDRHAVQAFEWEATDYLLKPVELERLRRAIQRVRMRWEALPAAVSGADLLLPLGVSGEILSAAQILYLLAEGHYSRLVLAGGESRVIRQAFREWVAKLPGDSFLQLDRGVIVNLRQVVAMIPVKGGSEVSFSGEKARLTLGSTASSRLRELLARRHQGG
jgi:two-component system LytT family response regulator